MSGIKLERDIADIQAIFAEIDRLGGRDFVPEGRPEQPPMPLQFKYDPATQIGAVSGVVATAVKLGSVKSIFCVRNHTGRHVEAVTSPGGAVQYGLRAVRRHGEHGSAAVDAAPLPPSSVVP